MCLDTNLCAKNSYSMSSKQEKCEFVYKAMLDKGGETIFFYAMLIGIALKSMFKIDLTQIGR